MSLLGDSYRAKVQALSDEENAALDEILEANGLTRDQLYSSADQILHIEMFLHMYPKMLSLHLFPYVRTMSLIHQGISDLEGLEDCLLLEKLWIVENSITQIKGLERLTKMKELYLYSNKIKKIEGLETLTNLEVLSLADNHISEIEGLRTLTKLRELNLARNDIMVIGEALSANTGIETLNLADNSIGNFKELRALSRMPKLVDLCFADPMWGECPVAGLCNYQTFVLFMLPKLTSLDTLLLADETKQLAEATFLKKQMYYNMRIKTLHRNARNLLKVAADGKKAAVHLRRPYQNKLVMQQHDIQRELEEVRQYGRPPLDADTEAKLNNKLAAINARLSRYTQQALEADTFFEECSSRMYQLVDMHIGRMMLELETAGNIRMEEGRPTDLWYTSCVDLVQSRFTASDYDSLGVMGLQVTGVTRIHNRWLRNRFERALSSLVDLSDPGYKRSMEYMFMGEHPAMPGEMDRVVEEGPRSAEYMAAMGLDAAVLLSNSVGLADQLRVQAALEQPGAAKGGEGPAVARVMIVKAYLGRTAADGNTVGGKPLGSKLYKDGKLLLSATLEGPRLSRAAFPDTDAVYRCKPGDSKQRLWYVFDHCLVVPEYLVELSYDLSPSSKLHRPSPGAKLALGSSTQQAVMERMDAELRPLARPLLPWLALHQDPQLYRLSHLSNEDTEVSSLISLDPPLEPRAKLYMLSEEVVAKHVGGLALGQLTYLNLHNCALRKLENMGGMPNLKVLVLTFNDIQKMEGLSDLSSLQRLDMGYNLIRRIEGLKGLGQLTQLDLACNQVSKLEEIYALKKMAPQLTMLDLSGNPVCEDKSYKPTALRKLRAVVHLDQLPVSPEERALFGEKAGAVTLQMILDHGHANYRLNAGGAEPSLPEAPGSGGRPDLSKLQELVLERCHLRRMGSALQGLVALRRASFADNQISGLEGLEACTSLEELCLEDNRISSLAALAGLTRLKKLQLGKNRLASLEGVSGLPHLIQLSVEDNELSSLAGVDTLAHLMELYAGNNRIGELREVLRLRELPKLIILDLSGNAMCSGNDDYRLYVIYNVRKLKVLDGSPIDAAEQAAAKSKYSGRLTLDFLEERLGHRMFDRIRDLDCSGLRLRDVGVVFLGEEFECLQELNLDGNSLVEVSGLSLLKQLVVLKLNGNKMGEECTFVPRRMIDKNPDLARVLQDPARGAGLTTFEIFPYLQVLQLGGNNISSISSLQLSGLTSLRTLFLQNNDITRIDGLEGLVNLQELVLDRNKIRYIDPEAFVGLPKLRELRLEENGLRSLANLHHLSHLQSLHLAYNRISEAADLDRLTSLVNLVEISLANNPIARKQVYRALLISKCPRLYCVDGQAVTYEEREYADSLFAQPAAMVDSQAGGPAGPKMAIRMTNLDFAGLANAQFSPMFSSGPNVPSIQSNTLVLTGPSALGLEGIGLRDMPLGGADAGRDPWGRPTSNDKRGKVGVGGKDSGKSAASPSRRQPVVRPGGYRGY